MSASWDSCGRLPQATHLPCLCSQWSHGSVPSLTGLLGASLKKREREKKEKKRYMLFGLSTVKDKLGGDECLGVYARIVGLCFLVARALKNPDHDLFGE